MPLTIQNEETCRLLIELGELTGASPEEALATALRLAVEKEQTCQSVVRRMMTDAGKSLAEIEEAIGRRLTQKEVDDWMYDEVGLPR